MSKISTTTKNLYTIAVVCALIAALFSGLKYPLTKLLITGTDPVMATAFIQLGAGLVMVFIALFGWKTPLMDKTRHVRKEDFLKLFGVVAAGAAGSILLNLGIAGTSAATSSVLANLTTVATAVIAFFIFKEKISKRLGIGIIFTTLGAVALSVSDISTFSFSIGALLIIISTIGYGFSYNFMKLVSERNPVETALIKGLGIAVIAFITAFALGNSLPDITQIIMLLLLGAGIYGMITFFLLYAQRKLGAAKSGAISGFAPVIGVVLSFLIYSEMPTPAFLAALVLVIPGMYFTITKNSSIAVEEKEELCPAEKDESLLSSKSEEAKHLVRNYLTAFAFLLMATPYFLLFLETMSLPAEYANLLTGHSSILVPWTSSGIFLLICAILLLVLQKRVLVAVTCLFNSALILITGLFPENTLTYGISGVFLLIFALILLTSKNSHKYIFAGINGLFGIISILELFQSSFPALCIAVILMVLQSLLLVYLAVANASERSNIPLKKYLTSDEGVDFRKCGSVLAYIFIAMYICSWLVSEIIDVNILNTTSLNTGQTVIIGMLLITGILLLFIGKKRLTPVICLGTAFAFILDLTCDGITLYAASLLLMILGIFAVLRKYSKLLLSLLIIGTAFSIMIYNACLDFPEVRFVLLLIDGVCLSLSLYLAFAVFSDKPKLPVF
ncbi:MAG TPA: DMT family transporter [Methanocorpusculum sp.]|nr:DMT family transporter [Methanocorpusculum sp.]